MSVSNILSLASAKMGLNPAEASQRTTLLRFLNEACYEIYNQCDMPGAMMEQAFKVNGDQTIAMPSYVGELRGLRELDSTVAWNIMQMRPRYNQSNWQDYWRNWRLKGKFPLSRSITNQSVLNIVVPVVETVPITVTITGQTELAANLVETVTMTATTVSTVNQFIDVFNISKSKVTDYDVSIQDIEDNQVSSIPNNELEAWFQIYDVSALPWLSQSSSALDHFVEVLYKKKLPYLSNDGDIFPAEGYDFIISNKMVQLWYQEQGNVEKALAYDTLTTRSLARKVEEANRATQDSIPFVYNPHDTLMPRIRSRRPGRYGGYGSYGTFGNV